jgi:NodT family efflux transporter outer membrane factor (OMF) lipoprotein
MTPLVRFSSTKHHQRAIAIAIVCSFLLVLPSCIPNLRKPVLAPPVPEDFARATSPENSAQLRIEEFYDDPLLIGLIDRALGGNQELRILNENIQIASNEVLARRGAYLPFVTAGGGPNYARFSKFTTEGAAIRDDEFAPGRFFPNPLPNYILGFNLFWQIDIWRQLRNARDAAVQRFHGSIDERNYYVTRLIAEVAENYYALMALDARLENLNRIIALQERSLDIARARKEAARGTDLPVQRFQAEVRKNQSEKLIVNQSIIQGENRINFLLGRFPQAVQRPAVNFINLQLHALSLGLPSQLLENRRDIQQAERELAAAGLDVKVARARFLPVVTITGGVGYEAFNPRYLFLTPEALIGNIGAGLIGPVVNFKAIKADYLTANARQLQTVYNYQRVIINAFTEVINRVSKVENYARSIEIKKQQVQSLEAAVVDATRLYQLPRGEFPVDYLDVLTAQNELFVAIRDLIDTKGEQLSAVVNTYQALGGGAYLFAMLNPEPPQSHDHWWRRILAHSHNSDPRESPPNGDSKPSEASAEAPTGPEPLPTPGAAAERGPEALPAPGAAERGPEALPAPGAAAERGPEPLPAPLGGGNGSVGGGTGSGTGTNAGNRPG